MTSSAQRIAVSLILIGPALCALVLVVSQRPDFGRDAHSNRLLDTTPFAKALSTHPGNTVGQQVTLKLWIGAESRTPDSAAALPRIEEWIVRSRPIEMKVLPPENLKEVGALGIPDVRLEVDFGPEDNGGRARTFLLFWSDLGVVVINNQFWMKVDLQQSSEFRSLIDNIFYSAR